MRLLVAAVLLVGCGSEECFRGHRTGTFIIDPVEVVGNCGPIARGEARIPGASWVPDGCELDAPDSWSDDQCVLDRRYTCIEGDLVVQYEARTRQDYGDNDFFYGTVIVKAFDADGIPVCSSTYDVEWIRK
jgi:hypothetical protein